MSRLTAPLLVTSAAVTPNECALERALIQVTKSANVTEPAIPVPVIAVTLLPAPLVL